MLMDSLEEKDSVLKSCNINKKTWAKRGLRALSLIIWSLQYAIQGTLFPSSRLQMIQAVDKRPWPKEMEVMKHETKYIKRPVFGMETGEEILIYNIYVKISNSSFTHTHTLVFFSFSLSLKIQETLSGKTWVIRPRHQEAFELLNLTAPTDEKIWHVIMGFYRVSSFKYSSQQSLRPSRGGRIQTFQLITAEAWTPQSNLPQTNSLPSPLSLQHFALELHKWWKWYW